MKKRRRGRGGQTDVRGERETSSKQRKRGGVERGEQEKEKDIEECTKGEDESNKTCISSLLDQLHCFKVQ